MDGDRLCKFYVVFKICMNLEVLSSRFFVTNFLYFVIFASNLNFRFLVFKKRLSLYFQNLWIGFTLITFSGLKKMLFIIGLQRVHLIVQRPTSYKVELSLYMILACITGGKRVESLVDLCVRVGPWVFRARTETSHGHNWVRFFYKLTVDSCPHELKGQIESCLWTWDEPIWFGPFVTPNENQICVNYLSLSFSYLKLSSEISKSGWAKLLVVTMLLNIV